MAVLEAPKDFGPDLGEQAPAGSYIATCFHVHDEFGVEKQDQKTGRKYKVNQTRFYFGFKGKDGKIYKVRTKAYTLSLADAASLPKFLLSWTGAKPKPGLDTQKLKGEGAMITVVHNTGKNSKVYADISSISPVMDELKDRILPVSAIPMAPVAAAATDEKDEVPF
jgi:hypothetical protein